MHTDQPVVERLIIPNCGTAEAKRCPTCGEVKPLSAFHRNARLPDGRAIYCKPCFGARQKAWRAANREQYLSLSTAPAVKTCRRCQLEQPLGNFYRQIGTRDGCFGVCKACLKTEVLSRQLGDPKPHRRAVARWGAAHPQLVAAARRVQSAVRSAIRSGQLVRPAACEDSGRACKPDAAHADYAHPLQVVWLCRRCRAVWDRQHPKSAVEREARP